MRPRADETIKAALRRSLPLIIGLVLLGFIAVNAFEQIKGPHYQATSQVEVTATPLSSIITNTQPSFVDPQMSLDTAAALAGSPQVYQQAAQQTGGQLGSAGDLQAATTVAELPDTDILTFTSGSPDGTTAIRRSNAVADAYITYRSQLHAAAIARTVAKLTATLATLPPGAQHDQVAAELSRAQLLQGADASDATVVLRAVSADKTSPAPLKDSVIGLAVGLVVALLVVALREAFDSTVRSEGDVEEVLSKPVLASMRPHPRRTKMVTYGRHETAFADAYALLAAQLAPDRDAPQPTVLAVTSSLSQEGKTTTAANLAVTAARRGIDVILADLDFRKPELTSLFHAPRDAPGALQVLDGSIDLHSALWSVDLGASMPEAHRNGHRPAVNGHRTLGEAGQRHGSLRLLFTGGELSARHASERAVLAPLLGALRDAAQLVVIDTPPALLTAEMTELAPLIDMAIVVVRQGYVSRRTLRSLAQHAASWQTEVAGAVLTDVHMPSQYAAYYGAR